MSQIEHKFLAPIRPLTPAPPVAPASASASSWRLRIGDADRQQVCALLGEHHAAGRLDFMEFTARQDAALAATTGAELVVLLRDLPPLATDPVTPSYGASTIGTTGRSPAADSWSAIPRARR